MTTEYAGRTVLPRVGRHWLWALLAAALVALVLVPIARLEFKAASDGGSAFRRMADYPGIGDAFVNTVVLAIGSVVVAVVLGVGLACCSLRVPRRLQPLATIAPVIPLMLPAVAKVSGWSYLLAPRTGIVNRQLRAWGIGSGTDGPIDVNTMPGIIAVTAMTLTPFVFLYVNSSLRQRGAEMEEAAAASGASGLRAFVTVTLPLLRPALVYSTGLIFLIALGQFTAPLILGGPRNIQVISTVMYTVSGSYPVDYGLGAAMALPLLAVGVAVVGMQRLALRDERRYVAVSGRSRASVRRTSWWATLPLAGYLMVAVGLPLAALIVVSLSPYWSGRVEPSRFTLDHWSAALNDTATMQAVRTTGLAVLMTLVIVIPVGYVVATALLQRTKVPLIVRTTIDVVTNVAVSMPAVLLGFAFLLMYTSAPFRLYGTTAIVVIAYVTLMLPHAVRPQLSALLATGGEYAEASRVSGAGSLATTWRIGLPMIRSSVVVAAALTVILVVHEFAVSLMITSPGRRVMGSLLYDATNSGTAPQVAVIALLMALISAAGILLAFWAGGRRAIHQI